jgi:hypothetical protein
MPNWVWNQMTLFGEKEELDKLESTKFDFNKLFPMPDEIKDDSEGIVCLLCHENVKGHCEKCGIEGNIGGRSDDNLNEKELEIRNNWMKNYGADGWYNWSIKNWGTKWNVDVEDVEMYRLTPFKLLVTFDTAWSPPYGIIKHIITNNNIQIYLLSHDEGEEHPMGEYFANKTCIRDDEYVRSYW